MKKTDLNSRVVLDRVGIAADTGGLLWCHVTLEEGIAVGVGVFSSMDVGVERVGGRANGQLFWSHWLSCRDEKAM